LERKREAMETQIALLRSEFEAEETEALSVIRSEMAMDERFAQDRANMVKSRKGDVNPNGISSGKNRKRSTTTA
jgi:hypothetical protein